MSGGWEGGWIDIIANSAEAEARANGFEVYSLSSVTFVYYRELNSGSFILVWWVAGLIEIITNSVQAAARDRAELSKALAKMYFVKEIQSLLRRSHPKR